MWKTVGCRRRIVRPFLNGLVLITAWRLASASFEGQAGDDAAHGPGIESQRLRRGADPTAGGKGACRSSSFFFRKPGSSSWRTHGHTLMALNTGRGVARRGEAGPRLLWCGPGLPTRWLDQRLDPEEGGVRIALFGRDGWAS